MAAPIVRARLLNSGGVGGFQGNILSGRGPVRSVSTQAAPATQTQRDRPESDADTSKKQQLPAPFRTLISDPVKHTREHIGKFYQVPKSVQAGLFNVYQLNKKARQFQKLAGEFSMMVRAPFLEARDYLRDYDYSQPALRIMLYGRLGTGKSYTMAHILHYAYLNDFLIIAKPWLPEWTRRPKEVQVNETNPLLMDSPLDAAVWLQHFRLLNADILSRLDLKTTKDWNWSDKEVTTKGESLENIVGHGVKRVKHACLCVDALLQEIKSYTDSGKLKTLVAIDGVNNLFEISYLKRPNRSFIPVDDFSLLRAFKQVLRNDWKNAAIVVTVDENALSLKHRGLELEKVPSFMPQYLLGKEGFEFFEPFIPIRTENYNAVEMESVLDYYAAVHFIQHPKAKTPSGREEFKFLSGYNPRELMKLSQWI